MREDIYIVTKHNFCRNEEYLSDIITGFDGAESDEKPYIKLCFSPDKNEAKKITNGTAALGIAFAFENLLGLRLEAKNVTEEYQAMKEREAYEIAEATAYLAD